MCTHLASHIIVQVLHHGRWKGALGVASGKKPSKIHDQLHEGHSHIDVTSGIMVNRIHPHQPVTQGGFG